MLPTRFIRPWDMLGLDVLDMHERSKSKNPYLLFVVDRASKFSFSFPVETKEAVAVARKMLELLMLFGVPRSTRSDRGSEFRAEVVSHLCRWLKVPIDHESVDHHRAQVSDSGEEEGMDSRGSYYTLQSLACMVG